MDQGVLVISRVSPLFVLAIVTLGSVRAAAMQEAVPNPAAAGFDIASITPNTSGTAAMGGIRFQQPVVGALAVIVIDQAERPQK